MRNKMVSTRKYILIAIDGENVMSKAEFLTFDELKQIVIDVIYAKKAEMRKEL